MEAAMDNRSARLLLVDDDEDDYVMTREVISEIQGWEFELEWASSYPAALEAISHQAYDVCLLDYNLGAHTGLEFLRQALREGCATPFILLTGQNDHEVDMEAMRVGAADYLYKGHIDALILERSIRYSLNQAQMMETLRRRNRELATLNRITTHLNLFTRSAELFDQIPHLIREALEYPIVSVWSNENNEPRLRSITHYDEAELPLALLVVAPQQVLKNGQPVHLPDPGEPAPVAPPAEGAAPMLSAIAVPLIWHNQVSGALTIYDRRRRFELSDRVVLETLAAQVAMALERIWLFESVEQEERQLEAILRGVADAILVLDAQGCLQLLNPAGDQLLIGRAEIGIGEPLPSGRGYDDLVRLLEQARHSGAIEQGEATWPDHRTFAALITPIEAGGQVVVLHDVTHFKDVERVKNEFIAAATHDLKTPLTSIMGYSALLKKIGPLEPKQEEFVNHIQRAATQMHELVQSLLELVRIDLGLGLKMEPCDLGQMLQEVADEFKPQAAEKEQTLTLSLDGLAEGKLNRQGLCVMVDAPQLRRVINNLVSNAIKYTPTGGAVTLEAEVQTALQQAKVQIQDTGLGIPPADQPFIFEKFYRVKTDDTKNIEGHGLGLTIVKSIVEQHGGKVWVKSEGVPGKGSRFGFSLPCVPLPESTNP
jgi:signal transduction histidine kinase/FixJ family two-component response regulator